MSTAFVAGPAQANHPEVSLAGSDFEIDTNANLIVDDVGQTPASIDWASVTENRKEDLPTGSGDDSFTQGSKEDTAVPVPEFGSIPPNKSDLKYFGLYREKTATKDFIHLYWTRVQDPSGTTNMDFEFNQSMDDSGNGKTPKRIEGDLLIQYDLARGGTSPILWVAFWLTDTTFDPPYRTEAATTADCVAGNSFPCWGKRINLTSAALATGSINTTAIAGVNADGLGGTNAQGQPLGLSARTFGEATVDFTQLLGTTGCTSFGSAYLKSRSSDSFTSAVKDFIAPQPVNISNCGTVIIRKQTDPDGATTMFDYTKSFATSPATGNTFQLADDESKTYNNVLFGTGLTVNEGDLPAGWKFDRVDCSDSTGVTPVIAGKQVTFALDAATDILDCTYYNETGGTVIIRKETDPATDPADWQFGFTKAFSTLAASDPTFDLGHGQYVQFDDVLLGEDLTVTEDDLPDGWDLISIDCDDGTVTPTDVDVSSGTVTFDMADADDVLDCTYGNQTGGTIIVEKITDSGSGEFEFTSTTLSPSPFTLTTTGAGDGGKDSRTFSDLDPGTYDVAETVPDNWNLNTPTCDDGSDPASIGLSPGETVTCTFVNVREVGAIEITKLRKHAADGLGSDHPFEGVEFTITGGELTEPVVVTTDENGVACATGLLVTALAGEVYTITETVPDGYAPVGTQTANVTEAADCDGANGGAVKTFENTPLTNVTVSVDSQVPGGTFSSIECDVPGSDTVSLADMMDDPSITIEDLEPRTVVCTIVIDP
ncbi:prealbumin-like fold domain-containing protein [Agromyces marinus]|uniref:prealbumin-like fold domain-containing protein n=1 Tax=Agromyces marinus TaxID=1389020 RepID=UPI001F36B095|nr:prealbumin-like fold domain-containing protein [Agromyces marinus]